MYNRFWEGRTNIELMTSKWSIAAMQCVCMDNYGDDAEVGDKFYMGGKYMTDDERRKFRQEILSLFSLMHATALAKLYCYKKSKKSKIREMAGKYFEVLPGINRKAAEDKLYCDESVNKVFLAFTWVQHKLIKRKKDGGLGIPPPIATRIFQELSSGMLGYNNCSKIVDTPFPFPYCQIINLGLLFFAVGIAFIMHYYIPDSIFMGSCLTFCSVGGYYAINSVADELETPFGSAANHLPLFEYHNKFNERLSLLLELNNGTVQIPRADIHGIANSLSSTLPPRDKKYRYLQYKGASGSYGDVTAVLGMGHRMLPKNAVVEELVEKKRGYLDLDSGKYDQRSYGGLKLLMHRHGSAFTEAFPYGLTAFLINIVFKALTYHGYKLRTFDTHFCYQIYTFSLGFFLVFRCSQAYGRYWEGRDEAENMIARWSMAAMQVAIFDQVNPSCSI